MSRKKRHHGTHGIQQDTEQRAVTQLYSSTKEAERIKKRMDIHQRRFYESLSTNPVTIVDAGAGRGKTTIAFLAAIEALQDDRVSTIYYVRLIDPRVQGLGFFPGDLQEGKEAPYMKPAYDALTELGLQPEAIDSLKSQGVLQFTTDTTLRGTNIKDAFIIIDEAQNASKIEDLRLVLTRIHDNCVYALIGHSGQQDGDVKLYGRGLTAFQVYQTHLLKKKWAKQCTLEIDYRGERSRWADEVFVTIHELEGEV